ncbi:MAG TPA: haloalkane dehalogenase [Gemmatimonadaceae bacterium]|nr:haloalkane dehalogenase [Gemmatimonadaceae bacterium]
MISDIMPYQKMYATVFDRRMAYVAVGTGHPIVFLHGNPTSSYLWRNIIPYVERSARCIAPDLIGMGDSGKLPDSGPGSYKFADHRRYLDDLLTLLAVDSDVVLVGHDWGSVLAFDWARRHPQLVRGIAYMEALVQPVTWDQWSAGTRSFIERVRSPEGERMILEENQFVEWLLPERTMRKLTEAEMNEYRRPFRQNGEARRPMLCWPRQLPIEGEPADVVGIVRANGSWLAANPVPKLFIRADPGTISKEEIQFCRSWPKTTEVAVRGLHFVQEDSPDEIGTTLAKWYPSLT